MRVAVVRTDVPFVSGGAERHAANLCTALRRHGHEAAEVAIPFRWYPGPVLVDHVLAARLIDLERFEGAPVDLMVGLKFPAWLARHPNKAYWILHQHRQAYDMWDSGLSDLLHEPDGVAIRELIRAEDRAALGAAGARVFANSGNVAGRLRRHLGIPSEPLYHPPPNAGELRPGSFGDYLLAPGRINPSKRQALMVEALAKTRGPARLVVAGPADSEAYLGELKARARALGVEGRIEWTGAIPDAEMVRLYAGARAVVYTPVDEDYGYVTLEAMLAGKPVIATTDAGGPLEFLRDRVEGLVVAPEAGALAAALDEAMEDPALAERMGEAGLARYRAMDISWDRVVERLVSGEPTVETAPAPSGSATAPMPSGSVSAPMPSGSAAGFAAPPDASPAPAPGADASPAPAHPAPASPAEDAAPAPLSAAAAGAEAPDAPPAAAPAGPDAAAPPLPDLAALRARLAPPVPAAVPFASVAELMAACEFDTWPTGRDTGRDTGREADPAALAYFGTHWRRYLATLALVAEDPPRRALDIGVFPPFLFEALMAAAFPGLELRGVWEGPHRFSQTVRARDPAGQGPGARDFAFPLLPANVERDPLPVPDASQDLVLAMEILEHFAVDPFHFVVEAARVLAPGGRIVITTPNVASHRGVRKVLDGDAPYSFGLFVPTGGVYGRHNREWAPREVARLAEAAGFETERLMTADVYDDRIDPEVARLLTARGDDFSLRGETILYVGRRTRRAPGEPPEGLYHGDPAMLAGRLTPSGRDPLTGRVRITAGNLSRRHWLTTGARAVTLYLEWFDARGDLVHPGGHVALAGPVAPGDSVETALQLDPGTPDGNGGEGGTVTVELYAADAGRFAGAGRANRLRLPCSEAAFLRLAGAAR